MSDNSTTLNDKAGIGLLSKWKTKGKARIYYAGWGYECCGDLLKIGSSIRAYTVSEDRDPALGTELYYDRHCNLSMDPALTFLIDAKVEKIECVAKSDQKKDLRLFAVPDTESAYEEPPSFVSQPQDRGDWRIIGFVLTVSISRAYS